jgi:hypothetical protein
LRLRTIAISPQRRTVRHRSAEKTAIAKLDGIGCRDYKGTINQPVNVICDRTQHELAFVS